MGCGGSKQGSLARPGEVNLARGTPGKLVIWGDYLNSDTRMICAVLKLQGIDFEFQHVNILKEENTKEAYIQQSMCETIPMISNNNYKVIGGGAIALRFLKNAFPDIKRELYQDK